MTFESILSKMGTGAKQITDRYAEYGPPVHEQPVLYAYEPQAPGHVEASSKHTYGGGHKGNAAMSALTLLAFLFFLHILQQCIKDHMSSMTAPQITIMTAGREGETALRKGDGKIDKTGLSDEMPTESHSENKQNPNEDEKKYLMKINTAEPPRKHVPNYNSALKQYGARRSDPNL